MGTDYHFHRQRITDDPTICGTSKLVFYAVSTLIEASKGGYLKLNQTKIGAKIDLRRETVNRHIKKLEAAGYLEVHRAPTLSKIPNIYRLPAIPKAPVTYFQAPIEESPPVVENPVAEPETITQNPVAEQAEPETITPNIIADHTGVSDVAVQPLANPPRTISHYDLEDQIILEDHRPSEDDLVYDDLADDDAYEPDPEVAENALSLTESVRDDHTKESFVCLKASVLDSQDKTKESDTSQVQKESDFDDWFLNKQTILCDPWFTHWYEPCYLSQHPYDDFEQSELPVLPGLHRDVMLQYLVQYGFAKVASLIKYAHEQENLRNPSGFILSVLNGKTPLYGWDELAKSAYDRWGERYYLGKYASYFEN